MKKRIVILLISVCLLMSLLLTSCELEEGIGNSDATGETTDAVTGTGSTSTDDTDGSPTASGNGSETTANGDDPTVPVDLIKEWFPEVSYANDGVESTVVFLTYDRCADQDMLFPAQEGTTLLSNAAFARTSRIKKDFGVNFENNAHWDCYGQLAAAMYASNCWIDLVYPSPEDAILMLENALLTDLNSYENIHLDQPWWNQSSVDTFTIDGHVYLAASEYSAMGQSAVGILYNRDLYQTFGNENLAELVENGGWTVEAMMNILMQNGAATGGSYDLGSMIFQSEHGDAFYWAMGGSVLSVDNDRYEISVDKERADRIVGKVYDLLYENSYHGYLLEEYKGDFAQSEAWSAFTSGRPLFMSFDFGTQFALLDTLDFQAGFLPLPKLEQAQSDYYTLCDTGLFMIPKKTVDPVRNSIILEALSIESYATVSPVLYEQVLYVKLSPTEEDSDMLRRIIESKRYDLGHHVGVGPLESVMSFVTEYEFHRVSHVFTDDELLKTLEYIETIRRAQNEDVNT